MPERTPLLTQQIGGIRYFDGGGSEDGRATVLLLHGLGNSLDYWTAVAPILSPLRVIAIDIPGFGQSARPTGQFSLSSIVGSVYALTRTLAPSRLCIVGHSLGAYVALELSRRLPRVASTVLVDGTLFRAEELLRRPIAMTRDLSLAIALIAQFAGGLVPLNTHSARILTGSQWMRRLSLWPYTAAPAELDPQLLAIALRNNSGRSILGTLRLAGSIRLAAIGADLDVPVSLIWGERDRLIGATDLAKARQVFRIDRELPIEACGHWPMLEKPDELAEFIFQRAQGD